MLQIVAKNKFKNGYIFLFKCLLNDLIQQIGVFKCYNKFHPIPFVLRDSEQLVIKIIEKLNTLIEISPIMSFRLPNIYRDVRIELIKFEIFQK